MPLRAELPEGGPEVKSLGEEPADGSSAPGTSLASSNLGCVSGLILESCVELSPARVCECGKCTCPHAAVVG